jgi:hypothetical protein
VLEGLARSLDSLLPGSPAVAVVDDIHREIAVLLFFSERTVESHLAHAYARLGGLALLGVIPLDREHGVRVDSEHRQPPV